MTSSAFNLEIESEIKKLNNDNGKILYYNEFLIINNKIQAIFKNIYKIDLEEKYFISIYFLINQNQNYVIYSLNEKYLINIGNINQDLIFNTNILIDIKEPEFQKRQKIRELIVNNEIQTSIDNLIKSHSQQKIIIKNQNKKIGMAYKIIKTDEQNSEDKNIIKEENKNNEIKKDLRNKINNDDKNLIPLKDSKLNEIDCCNNMIKLFVALYINYKEIQINIKNDIKSNGKKIYYLINKNFLKIYKEYYEFDKIKNFLDSIEVKNTFDYYFNKIIKDKTNYDKYINEIIKNIPNNKSIFLEIKNKEDDNIFKNIEKNSANNNLYKIEKLVYKINTLDSIIYHGENEIISQEFFDLFNKLETGKIKSLIIKDIVQLFFGENNIYIISDKNRYPFLNVGHYEDYIFKPDLLIYYKDKNQFTRFISDLEYWSFNVFIKKYDINKNKIVEIKDNWGKDTIGKICKLPQSFDEKIDNNGKDKFLIDNEIKPSETYRINSESMKLLKLIVYFKKFTIKINSSIQTKTLEFGYPIKKEFLTKIQKLKSYQVIESIISKNEKIKKIFETEFNDLDKDDDNFQQKIINELDKEDITNINFNKETINIYSNEYIVQSQKLILNSKKYNSINIINNFILLNSDIYNLFKSPISGTSFRETFQFLLGDNRIFILPQVYQFKNNIQIFQNNTNGIYASELELILFFENDRNLGLEQIKKEGFKKFLSYLLFRNDLSSPIFDNDYKMIGTAYKYDPKIKDYTDYNINFEIKKIFILYSNYQILKHKLKTKSKNNSFNEYYIVNKDWIQEYKNYYNFEMISDELDKIPIVKQIFESVNYDERISNIINNVISDKKLTLMIKELSRDIIEIFNKSDKYFRTDFRNLKKRSPEVLGFEYFDNNKQKQSLFYSYDFELISSEVYESLFKHLDINLYSVDDNEIRNLLMQDRIDKDEGKVECLIEGKRVIIKLLKKNIDAGNKYVLYLGKLNSSYIFEPNWFFLYDHNSDFQEHIKYILSVGGFNTFCKQLDKRDILELNYNYKLIGLAVKKIVNSPSNDINPNQSVIIGPSIINAPNNGKIDINKNPIIDNNKKNYESITDHFYFIPKIGLANIGATCYMNATLQCLCQIDEFASFFKYDNYVNIVKNQYLVEGKDCLTSSFKILIEELWPNHPSRIGYYEPREFRNKIAKMNPLFERVEANDAKDLVNFIIMTLHEELNKSLFYSNANNNNNFITNINKNDKMEVFKEFYQDYLRTFRSKISEIFYAIQETETKCLTCNNIQYNYQAYFFLVFPLEEVRKYAIQMNSNNQSSFNNLNNNMNNNDMNSMGLMPFNNLNNNMNYNMNNMGMVPFNNFNNNNNMNMNFNMNNMNNNFQRSNTNNMNNNNSFIQRFNSMDAFNNNININNIMINNMNNMMNNNMMINNNMMNNNAMMNNNMNNMMNNNMGMNMMNPNSPQGLNNFNNNINMNNIQNISINNRMNNNMNNFNMNNMNNFNGSNLSNIAMNNMFNMGMNNNMNNFNINNMSNINKANDMNNFNNMNNMNIPNNMTNNNINSDKLQKLYNNIVDISDCFEYNKKVELFSGNNQIYCNNCRNMSNAHYSSALVNTPKVLILLLNRGVGIQFKVKLKFTLLLNMSQYINQTSNQNIMYKLIGVITHLGQSGADGHFIAHCLSPIDKQWYTYNDAKVTLIEDMETEVVNLGMPYLLFYQRIE